MFEFSGEEFICLTHFLLCFSDFLTLSMTCIRKQIRYNFQAMLDIDVIEPTVAQNFGKLAGIVSLFENMKL